MAVSKIETRGCKPQTLTRPLSADLKSGSFSYTAPSDGILYLCALTTARTYWGIQWNGASMGDSAQYPQSSGNASTATIPVFCKKGDVITAGVFSANCYLIASRTAFISFD